MTHASKHDLSTLDQLTGGAFTAPTSGERAQRIRDWLATDPAPELMQEAFKEPGEYRVRARWRDDTGRCGHWSAPVAVTVR